MGYNSLNNLKIWRIVAKSLQKWGVKESAPSIPEGAAEWMEGLGTVQNASGIPVADEAVGLALGWPFVLAVSVVAILIVAGVYWLSPGFKISSTPGSTDGRQGIISAGQAEKNARSQQAIKAMADFNRDLAGAAEDGTSQTLLESQQSSNNLASPGSRAGVPSQGTASPEFSVTRSDQTATTDNDAMDALGFMMKGQQYFDDRPGAWDRFKSRHSDYQDLTLSALLSEQHSEIDRKAVKTRQSHCAFIDSQHALQLSDAVKEHSRSIASCNGVEPASLRSECLAGANQAFMLVSGGIKSELQSQRESDQCGNSQN